jgi:hypothetical protein
MVVLMSDTYTAIEWKKWDTYHKRIVGEYMKNQELLSAAKAIVDYVDKDPDRSQNLPYVRLDARLVDALSDAIGESDV